jgi:hypothetical protein
VCCESRILGAKTREKVTAFPMKLIASATHRRVESRTLGMFGLQ